MEIKANLCPEMIVLMYATLPSSLPNLSSIFNERLHFSTTNVPLVLEFRDAEAVVSICEAMSVSSS